MNIYYAKALYRCPKCKKITLSTAVCFGNQSEDECVYCHKYFKKYRSCSMRILTIEDNNELDLIFGLPEMTECIDKLKEFLDKFENILDK